jgi:RNA polymerase-binding transcription factor DksA
VEQIPAAVAPEPDTAMDELGVGVVEEPDIGASDASDTGVSDIDAPDVDASFLDSIEERLADVERALARLDEGTYGTCEVCGATVDDTVLVDAPATRFCPDHLPISFS